MQKLGGRLNITATTRPSQTDGETDRGAERDDGSGPGGDRERGGGGRDDEREEQQRADDLHGHRDREREQHHEQRSRAAAPATPFASATCGSTDAKSSGRAMTTSTTASPTVKTVNVRI